MTVTEFTPFASSLGGALIGVAAVMLMALNGRIAGISGIVGRLSPRLTRAPIHRRGLHRAPLDRFALALSGGDRRPGRADRVGPGSADGRCGTAGRVRLRHRRRLHQRTRRMRDRPAVVALRGGDSYLDGHGFATVDPMRHVIGG